MERHMEQQCWLLQSLRNVVMWLQLEDDMHHELIVASVLFGTCPCGPVCQTLGRHVQ